MPRLDNSHPIVLEEFDLTFDSDDPGRTPPIDLCYECSTNWPEYLVGVEHPPYQDEENGPWTYRCAECHEPLGNVDN